MSFARKFEVVLIAALALALVPCGATFAWGQTTKDPAQDKAPQDKAAKDKAAKDKAAQDKAAQDKAAQDKAAKDKAAKDKAANDKPSPSKPAPSQAAPSKPAPSAATPSKPAPSQAAPSKTASDKTAKDKGAKESNPVAASQDVLKKAQQVKTEEGRRQAAQEAAAAAEKEKSKGAKKDDKTEAEQPKKVQKPAAPQTEKGDPFVIPVQPSATKQETTPTNLPPGQAGLLVAQAEVIGFAKTPTGARALVRGPAVGGIDRVYFLKVGDKIYFYRKRWPRRCR